MSHPYKRLVEAVQSGELAALPKSAAVVYSTFLVLLGSGPRVLPAFLIAHCSGLSERRARGPIDQLVKAGKIVRVPLRSEHRERFTARYSLP
jgi:hypothetical protein